MMMMMMMMMMIKGDVELSLEKIDTIIFEYQRDF